MMSKRAVVQLCMAGAALWSAAPAAWALTSRPS